MPVARTDQPVPGRSPAATTPVAVEGWRAGTPEGREPANVGKEGRGALTPAGAPEDISGLVERARAGDQDAWLVLYRRCYPRLYGFLRRRLPTDADAREAADETMARAVASLHRFRWERAGFDGWLFGIARNVMLNHLRGSGRMAPVAALPEVAVPDEADRGLLRAERADAVRAAFARLGAEDRELLELRVVAGLSAEEVAGVLGRRPGAVRTAQSRALARLRRLLADEDL